MPASKIVFERLAQIELELVSAMREFPEERARERLELVRSLARFVKDQLEIEDTAKTPVVSFEAEPTAPRLD